MGMCAKSFKVEQTYDNGSTLKLRPTESKIEELEQRDLFKSYIDKVKLLEIKKHELE
eukprot:CAMPEP_0168608048 /NCGR_PEP_ID=MMETSP0449_2-20121227/409_1 /TAXON_ID=1082188 /ORGANISM="Strombidium rassoulzadegani, Strain ras09" /LENGTH=56 /DNA_ID=CAMNT_0008647987 /DNA_START=238 /DNA_END=408 /DNA_ORIENTATION=-